MEEQQSAQERTEQPTERRRKEAREKGQVARSRELNILLSLLFAAGAILVLGGGFAQRFAALLEGAFTIDRVAVFDRELIPVHFMALVLDALWLLTPFFAVMLVGALAGPLTMGGWTFSVEAMAFKWEKMNPVTGLKRVFSAKGLLELLKALFKFIVILAVATLLFGVVLDDMLVLGTTPSPRAFAEAVGMLQWSFLFLSLAMIAIVVFDVPFELWNHTRQLRMTRREVQDELKESEGRPEVKSRIRTLQRQAAQHRMMEATTTADVVVTNPTHFSVALKYDATARRAPVVVAKGADLIALKIRSVATRHDVAIFEAPPLARALYASTEINREIPENLYVAVAKVLAYVYQLRTAPAGRDATRPRDLPVPEEYLKRYPQTKGPADE